jgi:predicted adenylyl cyclase CyaB
LPSNVEIKARIDDLDAVERRVASVADGPPETIEQRDTFFRAARGRLKLREFADGSGELIHYVRPDDPTPKPSDYRIATTPHAAPLRALLGRALGVRGVVRKRRRLYRSGRTRIHVDRVEDLGHFLELEVVLAPGEEPTAGRRVAQELMARLGVRPGDLVGAAYIDLLER